VTVTNVNDFLEKDMIKELAKEARIIVSGDNRKFFGFPYSEKINA